MFLHHTMTDAEILRTCEGCDSQHLRLVADRLRARVDDLRRIGKLAHCGRDAMMLDELTDTLQEIENITKGE